jgi:hypothetical protein
MAVSPSVRAYYTKNIFLQSGRDKVPKNFRPLEGTMTGKAFVEGCAGGGKNILEIYVAGDAECVKDVRASCGLCNPAMYAAADVVCEWARGKRFDEVMGTDPLKPVSLDPLFAILGGEGRPDDAREKLQYALLALQNAVRSSRGETCPPLPRVAPPKGESDDD